MRACRFAGTTALLASGLILGAQRSDGQTGAISITPTRLALAANVSSGSVQLRNDGAHELRFQISARKWSSSSAGEMQLAPTQDLIVFPTVFALRARETRSVRVGASTRAGATELPYRLLIEELGNASDVPRPAGVQMLRRLNIPVFLQPAKRELKAELDRITIARPGVLVAHVRNLGSVHFVVGELQMDGRDAGGHTVVTATRSGWYVLPGDDIAYEIPFDEATCPRVETVRVSLVFRDAPVDPLTETARLAPGACAGR